MILLSNQAIAQVGCGRFIVFFQPSQPQISTLGFTSFLTKEIMKKSKTIKKKNRSMKRIVKGFQNNCIL